jgi:hypothetical protein
MAGIESIGFALWVQPATPRIVSTARSIPMCMAHSPPLFCSTESVCQSELAPDCIEKARLDAPISFRTRGQLPHRKDIRPCRKHISTKRCTW